MQFRDKDYLRTFDGLVFNVLGYDHFADAAVCGLKYVDGVKWVDSYDAALHFLRERYPQYVDQLISVHVDQVAEFYGSDSRLTQLRTTQPDGLLRKAVELTDLLSETLGLPSEAFGLTDSLLWGAGNEDSDIDLVIYGVERCRIWLDSAKQFIDSPGLAAIDPQFIQRPPHLSDDQFSQFCRRKRNQGYFHGTRFSVRGVRNWDEMPAALPLIAGTPTELELNIDDSRQSLFYPIIYHTAENVDIVSFHIGYEAALVAGDRVRVRGAQINETTILVGSRFGGEESIELILPA